MLIRFNKIGVDRDRAMRAAGYKFRTRPCDWIKPEGAASRFHGKPKGTNDVEIHLDVYTTKTGRHFTANVPLALQAEADRIARAIRNT